MNATALTRELIPTLTHASPVFDTHANTAAVNLGNDQPGPSPPLSSFAR